MRQEYLERSLCLLKDGLPFTQADLLAYYEQVPEAAQTDQTGRYVSCVFSFPLIDARGNALEHPILQSPLVRVCLLVYEQEQVIADLNGLACSVHDFLASKPVYARICADSEWMALNHYVLQRAAFPMLGYPGCAHREQIPQDLADGMVFLTGSTYVSRAWRRQGIFTGMLEMMRDYLLRDARGSVLYETVLSLDPDIPEYGPDAGPEPYVYNKKKDEPVRMLNRTILESLGFRVLRLEDPDETPDSDGTKIWFACRQEILTIAAVDSRN